MTLAHDKKLHMYAGFVIAISVGLFTSPVAGFVAATLAGAAKEVFDKFYPNHTAGWYDLLATVAGGVVGALLVWGLA